MRSLRPVVNKLVDEIGRVARGQASSERLRALAAGVEALTKLVDIVELQDQVKELQRLTGTEEE